MQKIPVGSTISAAYGFAFGNILSVLGIVWLPYVLLAAAVAGLVCGLAPDVPAKLMHGEFDVTLFQAFRRVNHFVLIPALLFGSMMTVGLQKRALGQFEGPSFVYFSLGGTVWRMIGAAILVFLILLFVFVLTCVVAGGASFALIKSVPHYGWPLAAAAISAGVLWLIYVTVRLLFFLPAVVVAEGQIGITRSWELGAGNFWRMFAVWFIVFVPVAIGFIFVWGAILSPFISIAEIVHRFGHPREPAEIMKSQIAILTYLFKQLHGVLPLLFVLSLLQRIINLGLIHGMIANAYLGVTGKKNSGMEGAA